MPHKLSSRRIKFASSLLMLCLAWSVHGQSICRCKAATKSDTTRQGANEEITIVESKPRTSVFGQVSDANGSALEKVLVEVFASSRMKGVQKKRIAACFTDYKGRFCFGTIPDGKYEVLYSLDGGWKHTSLTVVVAPKSGKSINAKIKIHMQVGT